MIRVIAVIVMTAVLFIALYIPAITTPDGFLRVLRAEHETNGQFWGEEQASQVLRRTVETHEQAPADKPRAVGMSIPFERASGPVTRPMSETLRSVTDRAFRNEYFRSVEALLVLVTYRWFSLSAILPLVLVFAVACFVDGYTLSLVRSKEFISQSAEGFGLAIAATILLAGALVILFFLPMQLPPLAPAAVLLLAAFLFSRAVSEYAVVR